MGQTIGLDGSGNVYVAGVFTGTNQIGTNRFVSAGGHDVFIVKLDSHGDTIWVVATGGPNDDSIRRLVVATNGALFVCGRFDIKAPLLANTVTNVFVARIDEGKFSWFDASPPDVSGSAASINFAPDESLWVVGNNGRIFTKHYLQDGTIVTNVLLTQSVPAPNGAVVAPNGNIFITRWASIYSSADQITYGLHPNGDMLWSWNAYRGYTAAGNNVVLTDGVLSVGWVQKFIQTDGFISKNAFDGTLLWLTVLGEYRGNYQINDAIANSRGYIHVIGSARGYGYDPRERTGLFLATLAQNGETIRQQRIKSLGSRDANTGAAIASDPDGNVFVTGQLMGTPVFGTNIMGDGPAGVANAFVARSATLLPVLRIQGLGANIALSWPRAAVPFALQQSDDLSLGAWLDVPKSPDEIGGRKEVLLPRKNINRWFRLNMTNEVPIRHLPVISCCGIQSYPWFLARPFVRLTTSNSVSPLPLVAYAQDADEDPLTFEWFYSDTRRPLTNGNSARVNYTYEERYPWYIVTMIDSTLAFEFGPHTVSLVASDGAFRVTNSVTFEVISVSTAIDELITVVNAANTVDRDWLIAPLQSASEAVEGSQFDLAGEQMREFKMHVQVSVDLYDSQKILFNDSAQAIFNALPSG